MVELNKLSKGGETGMKLVDAMIMSSKGVTIISSVTRKRYKPEELNAKKLGVAGVVFDSKAGVTNEEMKGDWGFVTQNEAMVENAVLNPVAEQFEQSLKEMKEIRKGEKKPLSWNDFMKELDLSYTVYGRKRS